MTIQLLGGVQFDGGSTILGTGGGGAGLKVYLQTAPSSGTTWTDTSGNGYNATLRKSGTGNYAYNSANGVA